MVEHVAGLISVVVFYILILIAGIIASRKKAASGKLDDVILANRSIGLWLSFFTLSATNIGGGYINGTAESVAFDGLLWTQAPVCYAISLCLSGFLFAPKMRRSNYITMFDPLQLKYGRKIGALLILPQIMSDTFWGASVLAALGNTVAVLLNVNATMAIIFSAAVVIIYTVMGGLYSVAYTDVIQFFLIFIGLYLMFPFAIKHNAVDMTRLSDMTWLGRVDSMYLGLYVDTAIMLLLGGTSWQIYYQRVLACESVWIAQVSTFMASGISLVLSIPPIIIGMVGAATDWNQTSYDTFSGNSDLSESERSLVLPLVMRYLVPLPISIIAMGTIAAAVMSSADSCILSSAAVFTKNIYCDVIHCNASEREIKWVLRISIMVSGTLATAIAATTETIYGLFVLCTDLMYVIIFPQFIMVLWFPHCNSYGCVTAYFVGFILRILAGEPLLKLPTLLKFPIYDYQANIQLFPFRTFIMLLSIATIMMVSFIFQRAFSGGWFPARYDILGCLKYRTITVRESRDKNLSERKSCTDQYLPEKRTTINNEAKSLTNNTSEL